MTGNNTKNTKTTVFLLKMLASARNCEGNIYIYVLEFFNGISYLVSVTVVQMFGILPSEIK